METNDTLKLTRADFDADNNYIGKHDLSRITQNLEIEANLGWLKFKGSINTTKSIVALSGSGIEAGSCIEAGEGIEAGSGIKAGSCIKAGWDIEAGSCIKAGEGIEAGEGIKAGWDIKASWGIEAGEGIEAGWGIEAGEGIISKLRIFAGLCLWRKPKEEEMQIKAKIVEGEVCFGTVVLIKDSVKTVTERKVIGITDDGRKVYAV